MLRKLMTVLVLTTSLLSLAACNRMKSGAKEQFARTHSCSDVTITERTDITPASVFLVLDVPPPADTKGDPGRLARWEADQKETRDKREADWSKNWKVFEASGCNTTVVMACKEDASAITCQEKL